VALQLTFTHPTRTVSIKPSDLRKQCKSMVFRWKLLLPPIAFDAFWRQFVNGAVWGSELAL
jgi:hypothetical protein